MDEQTVVTTETAMAITKRCPADGRRLEQITDPDFGLCWSCPKCGYLEPVE